jgi:hypothetical protein
MQSINNFSKGMNLDIDKSILGKDQYLYAENVRLFTESGNTSGALENITGNTLLSDPSSLPTGYKLCGYCTIRDELYLFMTYNDEDITDQSSIIVKCIFNTDGTDFISKEIIYNDDASTDSSRLNFNSQYKIKAIGRYESDTIKKIYWVDGHNYIRFANVANSLVGQPANKFDIIPNFNLTSPNFVEFGSGVMTAGKVQYAYQMYDINGGETLFSPTSGLISVSATSGQSGSNKKFKGTDKGTNTGKGIRLSILPPSGFSRIRVVAIKYDTINGIPTINIVADQSILSNPTTNYFYDNGTDYLGSYTYEEFSVVGNTIFSAKEIETKDDYLFVGNISQTDFDIDYDARAYRFLSSTHPGGTVYQRTAIIKETLDGGGQIWLSGEHPEGSGTVYIPWANVPEINNAINTYNDITNDGSVWHELKYQANGTTIGGSGININYSFTTDSIVIDNTVGDGKEEFSNNTDYSNVTVDLNLLGYQRDEIYRFGIVFYNSKGQYTPVKWIGDIRFPKINESNIATKSGNNVTAAPQGIYFTINTSSAYTQGAKYFRIVRCNRATDDRTILAQGPIGASAIYTMSPNFYGPSPRMVYTTLLYATTLKTDVVEFVSPEINFNKNLQYKQGDRLDRIGFLSDVVNTDTGVTNITITMIKKFHSITPESTYIEYRNIDNSNIIPYNIINLPSNSNDLYSNYSVDINANLKYVNWSQRKPNSFDHVAAGATKLVVKLTNGFTLSGIPTSDGDTGFLPMLCNYRRPIINSQYGGPTYQARQNSTYIECSDIQSCTNTSSILSIYRGDTYISMYDYLRNLTFQQMTNQNGFDQLIMYFPVETSINLRYRQDDCYSKMSDPGNGGKLLLSEFAGKYVSALNASISLEQKTDLYLYNSVYSQQDTTIKYEPKSDLITSDNKKYDTRILVSEKKINGETSDNWTTFKMDNFIDVDSTYGELTTLKNYRNLLYYWQPKGFGVVSVNPRSLLQDNNPGQLVLGTGGVLDRYDYISNVSGCTYRFSVVAGLNGLYWLDITNKGIYRYSNQEEGISKVKGVNSLVKDITNTNLSESISVYDKKNNEVLFRVNYKGITNMLSYSEIFDSFNSIYTFDTRWFVQPSNTNYLTINPNEKLYIHNTGSKCNFYGSTSDSKIKLIVNDNYQYTKTFDMLEYHSTSKNTTSNILVNTFSTIRAYNDYQNSNYQPIVMNSNLIRKERGFTLAIPRNRVELGAYLNPDIFDNGNLDNETRTFKERMRDKYLIIDLTYSNINNYNFSIPYITTNYRISKR